MPIPDNEKLIAEVVLKGNVASGGGATKPFYNIFHYRRTNQPGPWNASAFVAAFLTSPLIDITNALNVDYTAESVSVRCLNDVTDPYAVFPDTTPGVITGDRLPDFSAVCILLDTNQRGKSYRGRKHFGPFSESDIGDDVLNAGAITRCQAIGAALIAQVTGGDGTVWQPCVYSPTLSQSTTNPTNIITADIAAYRLNKNLGTMRKRKIPTVRA